MGQCPWAMTSTRVFFSRIAFSSRYLFSSLGVEFLNIPNLFPYFLETLTPVDYVLLLLFFVLFWGLSFGPPSPPLSDKQEAWRD